MTPISTERLRAYRGVVTNPDVWGWFTPRAGDMFIVTPPQCGTTCVLNIVMILIHGRTGAGQDRLKDRQFHGVVPFGGHRVRMGAGS